MSYTTKQVCVFVAMFGPCLIPEFAHAGRQYAPTQRRFQQRDPAGARTGPNAFVYGASNPLGALDPSGADISLRYVPGAAINATMNFAFWSHYLAHNSEAREVFFQQPMYALQELRTTWNDEPQSSGLGVCNRRLNTRCLPVRFTFNSNDRELFTPPPGGGGSNIPPASHPCTNVIIPWVDDPCHDTARAALFNNFNGLANGNSVIILQPGTLPAGTSDGNHNIVTDWNTLFAANPFYRVLSHEAGHCMGLHFHNPVGTGGLMDPGQDAADDLGFQRRVTPWELETVVNKNLDMRGGLLGEWKSCHSIGGDCHPRLCRQPLMSAPP